MAKTSVSFRKLSKKAQKALVSARRGSWGSVSPVQQVVESRKAYNRKRVSRPEADLG